MPSSHLILYRPLLLLPSLFPYTTLFRSGYPLQYSWVYLVAQMVKNLPVMPETWVRSLGWEQPLEEGIATHSSILAWT